VIGLGEKFETKKGRYAVHGRRKKEYPNASWRLNNLRWGGRGERKKYTYLFGSGGRTTKEQKKDPGVSLPRKT